MLELEKVDRGDDEEEWRQVKGTRRQVSGVG